MSRNRPVLWSEGLLLSPQHLQQWDRATHHLVAERFRQAEPFEWGLSQIEVDRESLRNGRFALISARGVLPDGTPFAAPEDDPLPPARALEGHFDPKQESFTVQLGLPAARPGRALVGVPGTPGQPTPRYTEELVEAPDDTTGSDERSIAVARRNLVLLFPDDALGDHDHLPIAEVQRTPEGGFALREGFVPPCLSFGASERLVGLLRNLIERLIAKSSELSDKRRQRGGLADFSTADTTSFLMLNTVNAAIPGLLHALATRELHPERVYRSLAALYGAWCTFSETFLPKDVPPYQHRALGETFGQLHLALTRMVEEGRSDTKATRIDLAAEEGSIWSGRILDDRLFMPGATFYLGVKADVEEQRLVTEMPVKLKVAARDKIDFLIAMALRGVPAAFTRVTPAALPVKGSYLYFQLDTRHEIWEGIKGSKNIGIFVPPEYPGLALELIGLRE